jgi:steroid 5-alpha reductase family enzyme
MVGILLGSLGISLALNTLGFIIAFKYKSDKLTDISYALSFITIGVFDLIRAKHINAYTIVGLVLVWKWALRIGTYLLIRVIKNKKDKRFDGVRENFKKFANFWFGQAIAAWVLMIPMSFSVRHVSSIKVLAVIGIVVWAIAFIIESLADYQKSQFKKDSSNKGKWIDNGIWHYSRHPNYFGEILVWIGIYIYTFSANTTSERLIGLASPIFIALLLIFVSGIPPLEQSADKKWGDDPEYKRYKARTSIMIPFRNKS